MNPDDVAVSNLAVTVQVTGKPISVCAPGARCLFSYTSARTPWLQKITLRSVYPRYLMSWRGKFVVRSVDDVETLKIGDERCDRFDLLKVTLSEINPNDDFVRC